MALSELSLFTGAGGGLLGTKLLGFNHYGYVEINDYCQRIIEHRINDGMLDRAPIFGDIRTFIGEGYAAAYTGMVDVVTAGFPCQPFSNMGKQGGENDSRNLWPETIEAIKIVRPEHVLLENAKGLGTKGYMLTIVSDLSDAGYTVWPLLQLGAGDCGAHHQRHRLWLYAAKDSNATSERLEGWLHRLEERQAKGGSIPTLGQDIVWPDVSDPLTHGSYDGLADRVERTKAIGNGQVPAVVATAWNILTEGLVM